MNRERRPPEIHRLNEGSSTRKGKYKRLEREEEWRRLEGGFECKVKKQSKLVCAREGPAFLPLAVFACS